MAPSSAPVPAAGATDARGGRDRSHADTAGRTDRATLASGALPVARRTAPRCAVKTGLNHPLEAFRRRSEGRHQARCRNQDYGRLRTLVRSSISPDRAHPKRGLTCNYIRWETDHQLERFNLVPAGQGIPKCHRSICTGGAGVDRPNRRAVARLTRKHPRARP